MRGMRLIQIDVTDLHVLLPDHQHFFWRLNEKSGFYTAFISRFLNSLYSAASRCTSISARYFSALRSLKIRGPS
jgi:hypothetical protein